MTEVFVAGFASCGFYRKAKSLVSTLADIFPINSVLKEFPTRGEYKEWLAEHAVADLGSGANDHRTSPLVWSVERDGTVSVIGGSDKFASWVKTQAHWGSAGSNPSESLPCTPVPCEPVTQSKSALLLKDQAGSDECECPYASGTIALVAILLVMLLAAIFRRPAPQSKDK